MTQSPPRATMTTPRDTERCFLLDELFFSTTNKKGVITYGNEVFTRVSGYSAEQLIGAPHNIIRHPDMPRCVFQLLWDTIRGGNPIAAYVKNMAADGSYYWVVAIVTPIDGGYLSIRLKPSAELFKAIPEIYLKLRETERALETDQGKSVAVQRSASVLTETLGSLGFASYDAFMHELLIAEITARKANLAMSNSRVEVERVAERVNWNPMEAACEALRGEIARLFNGIGAVLKVQQELNGQAGAMACLTRELELLSLNGQIRSAALPDMAGRTLPVVAQQMSGSTRSIGRSSDRIGEFFTDVSTNLKHAAALIANSDVSIEMMHMFLRELAASSERSDGSQQRIAQLAEVIESTLESTARLTRQAATQVAALRKRLEDFIRELRTLEILHITGKVEAVRCAGRDGDEVTTLFADVHARTTRARQQLGAFVEQVDRVNIAPPDASLVQRSLDRLGIKRAARRISSVLVDAPMHE